VSEEEEDTHLHENHCHMNWEMEKLCWQIDEKKRGDGQLGYNKLKI
jgi:hypothetical protein